MGFFCDNCGTEVNDETKFCPNCGKSLKKETTDDGIAQAMSEDNNLVETNGLEIHKEPDAICSEEAKATPEDSKDIKPKKSKKKIIVIIVIAVIVLALLSSMCSGESNNTSTSSSDQTVESADATTSLTEPSKPVKSLKATYKDDTDAGTEIDGDSDIEVVAVYEDGTEEKVDGWTVSAPQTLKAGKTSQVAINYGDKSTTLSVKCTTQSAKQYKKSCKKISYKKLSRNPSKYEGKKVKFTGEIIQVQEGYLSNVYRINVTKGSYGIWDDTVYVTFTNSSDKRFLEDDIVTFYGEFVGIETYTSVLGAEISIPSVNAKYMSLKK